MTVDFYWYINSLRKPPLMQYIVINLPKKIFQANIFVSMNGSKTFTVRQIWTRYHPFSGEIFCTCSHYMLWTFVNKRTIIWDNSCNPCCHTITRLKYFLFLLSTIIIHSGGCFSFVLTTVKSQDIFVRLITTWSNRRSFP